MDVSTRGTGGSGRALQPEQPPRRADYSSRVLAPYGILPKFAAVKVRERPGSKRPPLAGRDRGGPPRTALLKEFDEAPVLVVITRKRRAHDAH
jgi:hypothetical protein